MSNNYQRRQSYASNDERNKSFNQSMQSTSSTNQNAMFDARFGQQAYRPMQPGSNSSSSAMVEANDNDEQVFSATSAVFQPVNMSMRPPLGGYNRGYVPDTQQQTQSLDGYGNTHMPTHNSAQSARQTTVYDSQHLVSRNSMVIHGVEAEIGGMFFSPTGAGSSSMTDINLTGVPMRDLSGSTAQMPSFAAPHAPQQSKARIGHNDTSFPQMEEDDDSALRESWQQYQRQLTEVFTNTKEGNLVRAAETLMDISDWLLSRIEDFGLHQDDARLLSERQKLWSDFNYAWLALAFRQKQVLVKDDSYGDVPEPLTEKTLQKMGDELIRLCDLIEKHGLVDYQLGVWEEQIEELLEECLDLYELSRRKRSGRRAESATA